MTHTLQRLFCGLSNNHYYHCPTFVCSCIDKECNGTANYAKGHGDDCQDYRQRMHPSEVRIPITRTLGGTRHDAAFEACVANYYHRHEIVQWLIYNLALPNNVNILQSALYLLLTSVEMIAQLRMGGIFFMSIIVPMRWLSGNTHLLEHRQWGEKHMAKSIDLVYEAFLKIERNPKLFLKEDFMMNIFKPLYEQLPELEDYMSWYFEEKNNLVSGTTTTNERKKGMKLAREEFFYPTKIQNRESNDCCLLLATDFANCLILEFHDTNKVTYMYVSKRDGEYSMKKTTEEEKRQGYGIRANNDVSEGNFAVFDDALSTMGRGALSRAAAQGQSRYNRDFYNGVDELISGRKRKSDEEPRPIGVFHKLPTKLQDSLLATAKETTEQTHRHHVEALKCQREYRAQKLKDLQDMQAKASQQKFKEASWLHQQYHSPRCWKTSKQACKEFKKLGSHTQQLKYTKEQILIRYLGLGWEKAYHPWSKDKYTFTATELLEHLVKTVIPLAKSEKVPNEAPYHMPRIPDMATLGTASSDVQNYYNKQDESEEELRLQTLKQREQEELMGVYDQAEYLQEVSWPENMKKGYNIEKLFEYPEEGELKLIWCPGKVLKVIKKDDKLIKADIEWDPEFIGEGEATESTELLKKHLWNPSKPKEGAWRQDLRHKLQKIS